MSTAGHSRARNVRFSVLIVSDAATLILSDAQQAARRGAVGPVQPGPGIGPAQHGDLVPQDAQLGVVEADDRPSRTSQPQSRTKMR